MLEFLPVKPFQIPIIWSKILPDILNVKEGIGVPLDELKHTLEAGLATVLLLREHEKYQGVIVYQSVGSTLHLWLVNSSTGVPPASWEALQRFASEAGYERISFTSARKGWERLASRLGYGPEAMTYVKDLVRELQSEDDLAADSSDFNSEVVPGANGNSNRKRHS